MFLQTRNMLKLHSSLGLFLYSMIWSVLGIQPHGVCATNTHANYQNISLHGLANMQVFSYVSDPLLLCFFQLAEQPKMASVLSREGY